MTAQPTEDTSATDGKHERRYAELTVDSGIVIYDREHHPAWIQSEDAVPLDEMQ